MTNSIMDSDIATLIRLRDALGNGTTAAVLTKVIRTLRPDVVIAPGEASAEGRFFAEGDAVGERPAEDRDHVASPVTPPVQRNDFPSRAKLRQPVIDLLKRGPRSSREIEQVLGAKFGIVSDALLGNGIPAWRNHVSWVLVDLGETRARQIKRINDLPAPDGGKMGLYRLVG